MSQERNNEDALILRALEALEGGDAHEHREGEAGVDADSAAALREYRELLGLLPYELDPVEPAASVKEKLMASLPQRPSEQARELAPTRRRSEAGGLAARSAPGLSRWVLPLAAALAFLTLGLSAFNGWLFLELQAQGETIAYLSRELEAATGAQRQLVAARAELAGLQERMRLVTSPGVEVCPLRPSGEPYRAAKGVLFVAADHQHWYLAIHGLQPCPLGREYQVWFVTEAATVSAGTFRPIPGVAVHLSSETMPKGTTAVLVTMEPPGGAEKPSPERVLYGDDVIQML